MKLDELLNLLTKKTSNYINQSHLAEALGVTRQTISNRIKNESQVTVSELRKIEEFFNINIFSNIENEDIIRIDYYTDVFASCGNGNIVFSDEKVSLGVSTLLINGYSNKKNYSIS